MKAAPPNQPIQRTVSTAPLRAAVARRLMGDVRPLKGNEDDLTAPESIGDDPGICERERHGLGHSCHCGVV